VELKKLLRHFFILPLIFFRVIKKVRNFGSIFDISRFGFETEQHIGNLKLPRLPSGATITDLHFDSDVLPSSPLIFTEGLNNETLA